MHSFEFSQSRYDLGAYSLSGELNRVLNGPPAPIDYSILTEGALANYREAIKHLSPHNPYTQQFLQCLQPLAYQTLIGSDLLLDRYRADKQESVYFLTGGLGTGNPFSPDNTENAFVTSSCDFYTNSIKLQPKFLFFGNYPTRVSLEQNIMAIYSHIFEPNQVGVTYTGVPGGKQHFALNLNLLDVFKTCTRDYDKDPAHTNAFIYWDGYTAYMPSIVRTPDSILSPNIAHTPIGSGLAYELEQSFYRHARRTLKQSLDLSHYWHQKYLQTGYFDRNPGVSRLMTDTWWLGCLQVITAAEDFLKMDLTAR